MSYYCQQQLLFKTTPTRTIILHLLSNVTSSVVLISCLIFQLSRLTGIDNPEVQKTQYDFYSFPPRDVELDDEGLVFEQQH